MEQTTKKKIYSYLNTVALALLVFGIGYYLGNIHFSVQNTSTFYKNGREGLYNDVWNTLHAQSFNKNLNDNKLLYTSIQGMVNSLDDHATIFLPPVNKKQFDQTTSGNTFAGIGVELGYKENKVIVERIISGSPAAPTTLKVGDQLINVDGKSIEGEEIDLIVNSIRGTSGSTVKLTVLHASDNLKEEIAIIRQPIHVDSMFVKKQLNAVTNQEEDIVTISRFTEDTYPNWQLKWDATVKKIDSDKPSRVIIDLRDNPGGFFDAAVYALSDFLPEHTVAAMQQTRDSQKQLFYTQKNQRLINYKIELLVNANTASAAEIFSGAMQFYKKASVIGVQTYGKGTAQDVFDFADGSSLHVTTVHWLLPSSRWIQPSNAIKPDYIVMFGTDDFKNGIDPQLQKAEGL